MKTFILLAFSTMLFTTSQAQSITMQVLSSSGGLNSSPSIDFAWTVGETFTGNFSIDQLDVSNGFQQGWIEMSTIIQDPSFSLNVMVYPNPLTNKLFLTLGTHGTATQWEFQLITIEGKIIQNCPIVENQTEIDFTQYQAGVYFLTVIYEKTEVKTFKIIKQTNHEEN